MQKFIGFVLVVFVLGGTWLYFTDGKKLWPLQGQIAQERVGLKKDLQPDAQKSAEFAGSATCMECHKREYNSWHGSMHPKMVQEIAKDPSVVVGDFSTLPADANFALKDAVYTVGGKFKQRYMIRKDINGSEDYVLGNYQWNTQTQQWQGFKPWKYWYKDAYPHENGALPTSRACDGCHFNGFMSREDRNEPGVSCESCHGPGSNHVQNPKLPIYKASISDPVRQNEVCLQCHMRNRDMRLKDGNMSAIYGDARDYPLGYEAGKPLSEYKYPAPFMMGHATKEFYANGMAKKNRSQGNEFIHSQKSKHGITCINCHNPHTLAPTAQRNRGNDLCMECHAFGSNIGPHQKSLMAHTKHSPESKGSLCVECHMPKVGRHTGKSPLTVRTHMFGFKTPDETRKYHMPDETNACFACHKEDRTMEQLQADLESWGMVNWTKR